jgi:hypothetical protein
MSAKKLATDIVRIVQAATLCNHMCLQPPERKAKLLEEARRLMAGDGVVAQQNMASPSKQAPPNTIVINDDSIFGGRRRESDLSSVSFACVHTLLSSHSFTILLLCFNLDCVDRVCVHNHFNHTLIV